MNILTGKPSLNIDREGDIDDQNVFRTIAASEIPGTPQRASLVRWNVKMATVRIM